MSLIKANKQRRRNVLATAIENSRSKAKSLAVRTASELSGIPAKNKEALGNFFGISEFYVEQAQNNDKQTVVDFLRSV